MGQAVTKNVDTKKIGRTIATNMEISKLQRNPLT